MEFSLLLENGFDSRIVSSSTITAPFVCPALSTCSHVSALAESFCSMPSQLTILRENKNKFVAESIGAFFRQFGALWFFNEFVLWAVIEIQRLIQIQGS